MTLNDTVTKENASVADTNSLVVDGSISSTGAAEITELGGAVDCDIYREIDVDGDGTFDISHVIDSKTGSWHAQKNGLRVSTDDNVRLRINNTSGGSGSLWAIGFEVDS